MNYFANWKEAALEVMVEINSLSKFFWANHWEFSAPHVIENQQKMLCEGKNGLLVMWVGNINKIRICGRIASILHEKISVPLWFYFW